MEGIDFNAIVRLESDMLKKYLLCRGDEQRELFSAAVKVRDNGKFGHRVELRSVIEISNKCRQGCRYCTMGRENEVRPFSMTGDEIYSAMKKLAGLGRRTFLLQSGENPDTAFLEAVAAGCSGITKEYPEARLILCLGNLSLEQYRFLRSSGASRYILKFETGRADHYRYCKPKDELSNRLACIENLFTAGFQVGTGNIVGLPRQTLDDLVNDLKLTMRYPLSMVSATKFCTNERSEFRGEPNGDVETTLNMLALLRILHPNCLIPSTSSLALGNQDGQLRGLLAGCNSVTIHDGTAENLKKEYPIYSDYRFTPDEQYCRELIVSAGMTPEPFLI